MKQNYTTLPNDKENIKELFLKRLLAKANLSHLVPFEAALTQLSFLLQTGYPPEEIASHPLLFLTPHEELKTHLSSLARNFTPIKPIQPQSCTAESLVRTYASFTRLRTVHMNSILPDIGKEACPSSNGLIALPPLKGLRLLAQGKGLKEVLARLKDGGEESAAFGLRALFQIRTDEEMLVLLASNIRIVRKRLNKVLAKKVECLLNNGAAISDIRKNSHVLNNKSLEYLQDRCSRLSDAGQTDPLPVAVLAWSPARFSDYVIQLSADKNPSSCSRQQVEEVLEKLPQRSGKNKRILAQKVRHLLALGYPAEEVLEAPALLGFSGRKIQWALDHISEFYAGQVPLSVCHNYLANESLLKVRAGKLKQVTILTEALGSADVPKMLTDRIKFVSLSAESVNAVLDFLGTLNISRADASRMPIMLCHSPEVVRAAWHALEPGLKDRLTAEIAEGRAEPALNYLQYFIERRINFRMTLGNFELDLDSLNKKDDDDGEDEGVRERVAYDVSSDVVNKDLKKIMDRLNLDDERVQLDADCTLTDDSDDEDDDDDDEVYMKL